MSTLGVFHVFLRMETSERPDLSIVRDPDFHPCNHPCPDLRSIEFQIVLKMKKNSPQVFETFSKDADVKTLCFFLSNLDKLQFMSIRKANLVKEKNDRWW